MQEKYLMVYDNDGNIITFIPKSDISSYRDIPTQIIEITEEKHKFYTDNDGRYRINLITLEDELLPVPAPLPYVKSELEIIRDTQSQIVLSLVMGGLM